MKAVAYASCLIVILLRAGSLAAADPAAEGNPAGPAFVVYASAEDAEFGSSLFRVLLGNGKQGRFARADTIEQAIASEADVLVLVLPQRDPPRLEPSALESLKKRKIVGIGYGAAQLFEQLGLEINGGACAHWPTPPPTLTIVKSELLSEPKSAEPLPFLQEASAAESDEVDMFAVFLPLGHPKSSAVDVIARWTNNANYAPIVRQGNCILLGIPVPATQWTAAYSDLIRDMCLALHERELEAYATARHEVTKPGTYEFQLAKRGSTAAPFDKTLYFQFTDPQRFTAKLEHVGSDAVMLFFMGQDKDHTHLSRQDARKGETLKIEIDIQREDIARLGDRYWTLNVTNFGTNKVADCKLTITIEKP